MSVANYEKDRYEIRGSSGCALIFHHECFDNTNKRIDSDEDVTRLTKVLNTYGFNVKTHKDQTLGEISQILERESKHDYENTDCLLVAIMTGGNDNRLCAKDFRYEIDFVLQYFCANDSLRGKPKLFLIQRYHNYYGLKKFADTQDVTRSIPVTADIFLMLSPAERYPSDEKPSKGGWLIQSFCDELDKASCDSMELEINDLAIDINKRFLNEFREETGDESGPMPLICSSLTKFCFFKEKEDASD